MMGSMSAACPKRWTGMMPRVFGVIFSATRAGSMLKVTGSMSAKTGFAPARTMAPTVAKKVKGEVMISSPGLTCSAISAMRSASEPLVTPTQAPERQ